MYSYVKLSPCLVCLTILNSICYGSIDQLSPSNYQFTNREQLKDVLSANKLNNDQPELNKLYESKTKRFVKNDNNYKKNGFSMWDKEKSSNTSPGSKEHSANSGVTADAISVIQNSTLIDELKNSKFYARGRTNINTCTGVNHCPVQSRWGPARDHSYFLYDLEPYVKPHVEDNDEEEEDASWESRKGRKKRRKDNKRGEGKYSEKDEAEEEKEDVEEEEEGGQQQEYNDEEEADEAGGNGEQAVEELAKNNIASKKKTQEEEKTGMKKRHLWKEWGPWSPCSASCGKGTRSRWRHCMSPSCPRGEKQAQVKQCLEMPCHHN